MLEVFSEKVKDLKRSDTNGRISLWNLFNTLVYPLLLFVAIIGISIKRYSWLIYKKIGFNTFGRPLSVLFILYSWGQSVHIGWSRILQRKGDSLSINNPWTLWVPLIWLLTVWEPRKDAHTTVKFPAKGNYYVYVRTRNWTAQWSESAAGNFK